MFVHVDSHHVVGRFTKARVWVNMGIFRKKCCFVCEKNLSLSVCVSLPPYLSHSRISLPLFLSPLPLLSLPHFLSFCSRPLSRHFFFRIKSTFHVQIDWCSPLIDFGTKAKMVGSETFSPARKRRCTESTFRSLIRKP